MKNLPFLLLSLILSLNSYGEWTKVAEDTGGDSYYIDFNTIKMIDGYAHWWEMRDYIKRDKGNMSSVSYIKGGCETTRRKVATSLDYDKPMGEGNTEDMAMDFSAYLPWEFSSPGTINLSNLKEVCSVAEHYSASNYESKVQEIIDKFESYKWVDNIYYDMPTFLLDDQISNEKNTNCLRNNYQGSSLIIHIALHFIVPAIVIGLFFRSNWKHAYLVMMATMLIDIDHLLAEPIYDAMRCGIGFHPLHGFIPIAFYTAICFIPKLRIIGIGLVIHMALDSLDCQLTNGVWFIS